MSNIQLGNMRLGRVRRRQVVTGPGARVLAHHGISGSRRAKPDAPRGQWPSVTPPSS